MEVIIAVLFILVITLMVFSATLLWRIKRLEQELENIAMDAVEAGKSMQGCLDQIVEEINKHSENIYKNNQAIDYLIKDYHG